VTADDGEGPIVGEGEGAGKDAGAVFFEARERWLAVERRKPWL
jgi:hypothetical protein